MAAWYLGLGIVCIVLAVALIWREPRRIENGFIFELGLLLVASGITRSVTLDTHAYVIEATAYVAYYALIALMGVALIADGIFVLRREGLSIAHALPIAFGLGSFVVCYVGFREMYTGMSGSELFVRAMNALEWIVLYVPYAIAGILVYSIVYALLPKRTDVDFIVVLGCGLMPDGSVTPHLRARLNKAIAWYEKGGRHARFVTSGGQGGDEAQPEARAMEQYLLGQGIPAQGILVEEKSTTTRENLLFSRDVIEAAGGGSMIICTSNYHALRAAIFARKLGIDAQAIGGKTAAFYLPVAFLRECMAVIFSYKLLIPIYIVCAVALSWI